MKIALEFRPSQTLEPLVRDLFEELHQLGFEPELTKAPELRGARVAVEVIAIYVGMKAADATITKVVDVVGNWFWRRVREAPETPPEIVVFGPNGEELKRVPMRKPPPPD